MKPNVSNEIDLTKLKVIIDDEYEIYHSWLIDINIKWSIFNPYVSGVLVFDDVFSFSESVPLGNNNKLSLSIDDSDKENFKYDFIITDISKTIQNKKNRMVTIRFIDIMTFEGSQQYISKGYKDSTVSDIIKDLKSEYFSESTDYYKEDLETGNKYENYIIPGNKTINRNINEIAQKSGLFVYKNRKEYILTSYEKLITKSPLEIEYVDHAINDYYRYYIDSWEYNSKFTIDESVPDIKKQYFRPFDKKVQEYDLDFTTMGEEFKFDGSYENSEEYNVESEILGATNYVNPSYSIGKNNLNKLVDKNILSILTNGDFTVNVGDSVKIKISAKSLEIDEFDNNASGTWMITELNDHIIGSGYYMSLKLQRAIEPELK